MNGQLVCFDAHDAISGLLSLFLFCALITLGMVRGLTIRARSAEFDLARERRENLKTKR